MVSSGAATASAISSEAAGATTAASTAHRRSTRSSGNRDQRSVRDAVDPGMLLPLYCSNVNLSTPPPDQQANYTAFSGKHAPPSSDGHGDVRSTSTEG